MESNCVPPTPRLSLSLSKPSLLQHAFCCSSPTEIFSNASIGSVLCTVYAVSHFPREVRIVTIPILQMIKIRPGEVR